jgi:hypothetical protein
VAVTYTHECTNLRGIGRFGNSLGHIEQIFRFIVAVLAEHTIIGKQVSFSDRSL